MIYLQALVNDKDNKETAMIINNALQAAQRREKLKINEAEKRKVIWVAPLVGKAAACFLRDSLNRIIVVEGDSAGLCKAG